MTHEDLQDLKKEGYTVSVFYGFAMQQLQCPRCSRPLPNIDAMLHARYVLPHEYEARLECPHCGHSWRAHLKMRYEAIAPGVDRWGEVTE